MLELSASLHGLSVGPTLDRVMPWLGYFNLAPSLDELAEDYSRGMKKKLGLILALLHAPRLLILDEPTSGMDVESTHMFYELMRAEAAQGTTVLFSTHLMDQVGPLCHQAAVLDRGRLVAAGSIEALRAGLGANASLEDAFLHLTADASAPARSQ